jgi:hypothetical protein
MSAAISGIVVYEICVEVSGQLLAEVFVRAIIKLAVIAVILLLAPAAGGAAVLAWTSPLKDSVGPDGSNGTQDVRYVQALLGDWRSHNNGSLLSINGEWTDEATSAVTDFQSSAGLNNTAGTISPGDATLAALERTHLQNGMAAVTFADMENLGMNGLVDVVFADNPDGVDPDPEANDQPDVVAALNTEFETYLQDVYNSVEDLA